MNSTGPLSPQRSPAQRAGRLAALPVALRLILGLVLMVLAGTLLFMLPGIGTRSLSFSEALFTAASALTVTGLTVIIPATDLTFAGQALLLVMIQVGGIGLMILTVIVFRLLGRRITLVDRLALRDMFGTLLPDAILRLTTRVMLAVLIIEALGALLLWLVWSPRMPAGEALWFAIFHSVSAFCNSGFDLFAGLPGYAMIPNDGATLAILGSLVFTGSLGVPVVADLLSQLRQRHPLSLHTRLTLVFIAGITLLSTLVFFAGEGLHPGVLAGETWDRRIGLALFQSISARTAGFVAVPSYDALAPSSQLMLIVVMFIGAAPASMGGGITTGTAIVLGLALWSYARNRPDPEVRGRSISPATIRRATAVLTISLLVVLAATLLLLLSDPSLTLDGALFEVVSAFATCGLTLAYTPRLNLFGQLVIVLVMIWGRLGALSVMVALTRPTTQQHYHYPEEPILIG
jgi:trk system potassium uptake protein TrkH